MNILRTLVYELFLDTFYGKKNAKTINFSDNFFIFPMRIVLKLF